jgi:hypothetical protein
MKNVVSDPAEKTTLSINLSRLNSRNFSKNSFEPGCEGGILLSNTFY